ncbi:unnamed protein product [Cyprideis torosa]|uniref:Uncharacterized protein n=1 Tax=Cyprideis torosa TaxID=163714 RepID=A0A7R8W7V0_9CRUS|nr:unnamed protein product [Cyprideis torosa]CAG0886757.1 unnamed protein product [Cyprideis torosa]
MSKKRGAGSQQPSVHLLHHALAYRGGRNSPTPTMALQDFIARELGDMEATVPEGVPPGEKSPCTRRGRKNHIFEEILLSDLNPESSPWGRRSCAKASQMQWSLGENIHSC